MVGHVLPEIPAPACMDLWGQDVKHWFAIDIVKMVEDALHQMCASVKLGGQDPHVKQLFAPPCASMVASVFGRMFVSVLMVSMDCSVRMPFAIPPVRMAASV